MQVFIPKQQSKEKTKDPLLAIAINCGPTNSNSQIDIKIMVDGDQKHEKGGIGGILFK